MGAGVVRSPGVWPGLRLAVDCGAVWTDAALGWSGGRGRLVSFGGSTGLPSGVLVRADGTVVVGVAGGRPGVGGDGSGRYVAAPIGQLTGGPLSVPAGATVEPIEPVELVAAAAGMPVPALSDADRVVLLRHARTAKEALTSAAATSQASTTSTVVALPAPLPPVVVGVDELAAAVGPVVQAGVAATRQ